MAPPAIRIEQLQVRTYTVPTEEPESDGTIEWDATTVVVVQAHAGGRTGTGYTYAHAAAATLIGDVLADVVVGGDALTVERHWSAQHRAVRNIGRKGLASYAISAVDIALWDLKARLLERPLATLLGDIHDEVPVYGSGGFTSYSEARLRDQLAGWVAAGIPRVKMKVGRDPGTDARRVAAARSAIGADAALYVDANGAYSGKQALGMAARFDDHDVTWFEEPVSSDDLAGLRLLRDRAPAGMDITAGEYATVPMEFRELLAAGVVDCMQADVTRCGGFTGFLQVAALCEAAEIDLSSHTAPNASAHACAATRRLRHLELFHDHVRVEDLLFDGGLSPDDGALIPDRTRPGLGLDLRHADVQRYAA